MRVTDIIRPEDSRFETVSGIDFSLKMKAVDVVKTTFWISVAFILTSYLSKLV